MREFSSLPCRRVAGAAVALTPLLWLVVAAMPQVGANEGTGRVNAQKVSLDPSGPLVITAVACNSTNPPSVSVTTNYAPPEGSTWVFTNTVNGQATLFPPNKPAHGAAGPLQLQFRLVLSKDVSYRLNIQGHQGTFLLTKPYLIACNSPASAPAPATPQTAGAGNRAPATTKRSKGGIASPEDAPNPCPNVSFTYQSRTNNSVVNASLALTNNGPGNPVSVTVTGITCNNGFDYAPQKGLLTLPFLVPGATNLPQGETTKFNAFFRNAGGSQLGSFTCTLTYTEGKSCKGTGLVTIPSHL